MCGDRRFALLTAACIGLAVCGGAASLWIPAARGAVVPSVSELMVGWTLLVASALLVRRARVLAVVLWVAGLTWVGVGLAPYAGTIASAEVARLALLPTALVAIAGILLPRGQPATRFSAVVAALVIATAVAGGLGWYRYSIAIIGILALLSATPRPTSWRLGGPERVRLGLGVGLTAVGVLAASAGAATPLFVSNLHDLVMIAGAAVITWSAKRETEFARSGRIDLDEPSALGTALGVALGRGPLSIAFPGENATWLDPSGNLLAKPSTGAALESETGSTIAWLTPHIRLDTSSAVTVHRLLTAAGEAARLRAALRDRAAEIDQSRQRLESAADGERARLISLLEAGPLASLAQAGDLLASTPTGCSLTQRVSIADRVLGDVVRGLDPVAAAGGLLNALAQLADDSGATHSFGSIMNLGPTECRAVWFTCAEALANAARHAPGAAVEMQLHRRGPNYEFSVRDDGPGGANASGSGLSGLRDRAATVGGRLIVDSRPGTGTTLRLVVPALGENARCHVRDAALAPIRNAAARGTVDA